MKKLTPYCIFISSFIIGFFFAIQIQTGINISPDNLIINVADKIIQQMPQFLSMWKNIKLLITIMGIIFFSNRYFSYCIVWMDWYNYCISWIFVRIINNFKCADRDNNFIHWSNCY